MQGPVAITFGEVSLVFVVADGCVDVGPWSTHECAGVRVLGKRVAKETIGSVVPLRFLLNELYSISKRPSRLRSLSGHLAVAGLRAIIDTLHDQIELSMDESWWQATSCLELAPKPSKFRSQQLSFAYKAAVTTAVRTTAEPLSLRQLLGARSVIEAASANTEPACSSATARRLAKDKVVGLLSVARQVFLNPPALHYTLDGVQAGGDANNVFIAWLPRLDIVGFPPIQVQNAIIYDMFFFTSSRLGGVNFPNSARFLYLRGPIWADLARTNPK